MKLRLLIILSLIFTITIFSVDKSILRIAIPTKPVSLDPRYSTDAVSSRLNQLLYSSLFKKDINDQLIPDLVESYKVLEDKKTYVLNLRKGVKFHNGKPLTARDVAYTFNSILNPEFKSPKRGSYRIIDEIKVKDDYTVIFRTKEVFSPFLIYLVQGIVPEPSSNKLINYSENPIGSGPFKFVSYQRGVKLVLERNDDYYSDMPKLKKLVFRIIPDENIRVLELEKGSIDFIQNNIPYDSINSLRKNRNLKFIRWQGTNYSYIGFNFRDKLTGNIKLRKAIAYGLNRDKIIQYIFHGFARKAYSVLPETHWAYCDKVKKYEYSRDRAIKLVKELEKEVGGKIKIHFKTSTNKFSILLAEIFRQELRKIGIDLDISSYEWGTFYDDIIKGNFQMYSLTWVGISDPDIFYSIFHSKSVPPNGRNRGHYSNEELDELVTKARQTLELNLMKRLYCRVQQIISEDLPYVHLWHTDNFVFMKKYYKNLKKYPAGDYLSLIYLDWD